MSPEEWLGIVHWLSDQDVKWTVDVAAKYGLELQRYDADRVRQAMTTILDRASPITTDRIVDELKRKPSKFTSIIETSHLRQYPNGCQSRWCDVCLDNRTRIRHNT